LRIIGHEGGALEETPALFAMEAGYDIDDIGLHTANVQIGCDN
jgi:hypothetical protein|tara:strand:+ start:278 stop:406 length:129 start_codon:yes stop_codon:yes gene_type:complete